MALECTYVGKKNVEYMVKVLINLTQLLLFQAFRQILATFYQYVSFIYLNFHICAG